jgi:DNA polymerase I
VEEIVNLQSSRMYQQFQLIGLHYRDNRITPGPVSLPFLPYFFIRAEDESNALKVVKPHKVDKGKFETWDHYPAIKLIFKTPKRMKIAEEKLTGDSISTYEADLFYARRVMIDEGSQVVSPKEVLYWDIETDSRKRMPSAEDPFQRIIHIGALDYSGKRFDICDEDEAWMITEFNELKSKYKAMAGWFTSGFDIPYLISRASSIGIQLDPFMFPDYDMLKIYQRFFKKSQESYALSSVVKKICGYEIEDWGIDGTVSEMYDMFLHDKKKLTDYTFKQLKATKDINEKLGLIERWNFVCNKGSVVPYARMKRDKKRAELPGNSSIVDNLVLHRSKELGDLGRTRIVWSSKVFSREEDSQHDYIGGYVKDPSKGLWNNVIDIDAMQQYPAIIKTFNIGLETYCADRRPENIKAFHGSFLQEPRSVLSEVVKTLSDERYKVKKERNKFHPNSSEYYGLDNAQKGLKYITNCFTEDHYVWTPTGLECITDFREGDLVYTLNPETFGIEVSKVTRVIKQSYKGKMYNFCTDNIDVCVTPNHRFYLGNGSRNNFRFYEAQELQKTQYKLPSHSPIDGDTSEYIYLPEWVPCKIYLYHKVEGHTFRSLVNRKMELHWGSKCYELLEPMDTEELEELERNNLAEIRVKLVRKTKRKWDGSRPIPWKVKTKDFMSLLGWYISEGCVHQNNRFHISISQKNAKNRKEIYDLLHTMQLHPRINSRESGVGFCSFVYSALFEMYGGSKAYNKKIHQKLFTYSATLLQNLWDSLIKGDGTGVGAHKRYITSSVKLTEDIAKLAIHLGYIPYIRKKVNHEGKYRADISISPSRQHAQIRPGRMLKRIPFSGEVYCITTEKNHIILAGRNGKFCWLGQSVYGICGFPGSRYFKREIAENITMYARTILQAAITFLSNDFTALYGDTDSVFMYPNFEYSDFNELIQITDKRLKALNERLTEKIHEAWNIPKKQVEIQFQYDTIFGKLYLTSKKKCYAGMVIWQNGEMVDPYVLIKGFETVRTSTLEFSRDLQSKIFGELLKGTSMGKIARAIPDVKSQFLSGKYDAKLFYRMGLNKEVGEYATETATIKAYNKLKGEGKQVRIGDKIKYVRGDSGRVVTNAKDLSNRDRISIWDSYVGPMLERLEISTTKQEVLCDV